MGGRALRGGRPRVAGAAGGGSPPPGGVRHHPPPRHRVDPPGPPRTLGVYRGGHGPHRGSRTGGGAPGSLTAGRGHRPAAAPLRPSPALRPPRSPAPRPAPRHHGPDLRAPHPGGARPRGGGGADPRFLPSREPRALAADCGRERRRLRLRRRPRWGLRRRRPGGAEGPGGPRLAGTRGRTAPGRRGPGSLRRAAARALPCALGPERGRGSPPLCPRGARSRRALRHPHRPEALAGGGHGPSPEPRLRPRHGRGAPRAGLRRVPVPAGAHRVEIGWSSLPVAAGGVLLALGLSGAALLHFRRGPRAAAPA